MRSGTDPESPSSTYLDEMSARTRRAVAGAAPITSPHIGAPAELRRSVTGAVERAGHDLRALSHDLHTHPELGFREEHAVRAVDRTLNGAGYRPEVGVYGLTTALRARAGTGKPRVAILAEYDALPEIGHACGHNVICATAVGAFLATAAHVNSGNGTGGGGEPDGSARLGGSVELIGTPAEEGGGGKEIIAAAGGFDDVDAVVMLHPYGGYDIAAHPFLGRRTVKLVYRGVAAHASAMPFMGRNALDGVVAAYNGIAAMRQHMLPSDRVHGVITEGGSRPNIVPDRAAAEFYVRSAGLETLLELSDRVHAIAEGAATMTGTGVEIAWDTEPPYLPIRHNDALASRYAVNMGERGRPVLPPGVVPELLTGSTDLGNVSVRVPAIHPMLSIGPASAAMHTATFAEHAASADADRGVLDGAAGLALTAADYLSDPALQEAVAAEFAEAGGPTDVPSLLNRSR